MVTQVVSDFVPLYKNIINNSSWTKHHGKNSRMWVYG